MTDESVVHVIEDDRSMRVALLRLLTEAGFCARGYGSAGEFLLEPLPDFPSCLLLDIQLPGPSGLELQAALERRGAAPPVIFLTGCGDVSSSVRAMKAGAVDFLEKPVDPAALLDLVRSTIDRDRVQRQEREDARRLREMFENLQSGQRQILDRVLAGKLNKQIAYEMNVSERTIKSRRAELMKALGAKTLADLAALAGRLGELTNRK